MVCFSWVPAHEGVAGNEAAHAAAQHTTKARTKIDKQSSEKEYTLESALLRRTREATSCRSQDHSRERLTGAFTKALDAAFPGKYTRELYERLSRAESNKLAQLRTGYVRFNDYLARCNIIPSPVCECGAIRESIRHFLPHCPR